MRFISAIYVSSALFWAASAAPVPELPNTIVERDIKATIVDLSARFDTLDDSELTSTVEGTAVDTDDQTQRRSGGDVFVSLDLAARQPQDESIPTIDAGQPVIQIAGAEDTGERSAKSGGCVVA
ncbi:hypothetical protein C8R43DRAFT_1100924 [Mycena crocata]|nr:hypothetical protein C8R43DRAFT_1100924 [Mycena crocata]